MHLKKVVSLKSWVAVALGAAICVCSHGAFAQSKRVAGFCVDYNISPADIAQLGQWGGNIVRYQLPVFGADHLSVDEYLVKLSENLQVMINQLPLFQAQGVKVLVHLSDPPGGFARRTEPALFRIFSEAEFQNAFIPTWQMIATALKGRPEIWGVSLLNEPAEIGANKTLKKWPKLAEETIAAVRAIDPNQTMVIAPRYGNPQYLRLLDKLAKKFRKDPKIYFSFHYYGPILKYLHQGIYSQPFNEVKYPTKKFNKNALKKSLERVRTFQRKGKANIIVTEFAVARWAPGAARFLNDTLKLFKTYKFSATYLGFRGTLDAFDVEYDSNYNNHTRSATLTDRGALLRKFFAGK